MEPTRDLEAWLTLIRAPRLGAAALRARLLQADSVPAALRHAVRDVQLAPATRAWLRQPDRERLAADLAWLAQPAHGLLCCTDEAFPPLLEAIADPPAALFYAGRSELLLRPQLAIVGARAAGPAQRADARLFAAALARSGLVITSGLALGIDGVAHRAALAAGGATVAVLGTGVDLVYPRQHAELAAQIVADGVLVSEFPLGSGARKGHFPRRNRIISGLSLGTFIVAAGVRSGSLITARLAAEQGREVFALPGSIHDPLARGCHRLIRDGAGLVETLDDILPALRPLAQRLGQALRERLQTDPAPPRAVPTPEAGAGLLAVMPLGAPVATDTLSLYAQRAVAEVATDLLELELAGYVAVQDDGRWVRVR